MDVTCITCPTQFFVVKTNILSFFFNQIEHNQSFHRNELDYTIRLFLLLPTKKTCFYSSNSMKFKVNGIWFTFNVFELNSILQLNF